MKFDELSTQDARHLYELAAQRWFSMTADEFATAYDGGAIERDTARANFVTTYRQMSQ